MSTELEVIPVHPKGEVEIAANLPEEAATTIDTFAGKVHVKWSPEAEVVNDFETPASIIY